MIKLNRIYNCFSIFFIAVMAIACNSNNNSIDEAENIATVKKEYFDTGELKNEIISLKNNKLLMAREYYKSGQLKSISYWNHNSEKDSVEKQFYENGILKVETFWSKGKRVGLFKSYFPTGAIRQYAYHKKNGAPLYSKIYKKNGEIEYEKGYVIEEVIVLGSDYENKFRRSTPVGVGLKIIAPPPNCIIKAILSNIRFNDKYNIPVNKKLFNDGDDIYYYSTDADTLGAFELGFKISIIDTLSGHIFQDSAKHKVEVVPDDYVFIKEST